VGHSPVAGIDHVVICVHDLERARATYARLGFGLTPRGHHTLGSQNHCIMFGRDYIELLAVPRPHPANQYFTDFLSSGDGLAAIALASDDADAAHAAFRHAGIEAAAPVDFSRPVELPGGARDARFRILQLPAGQTPGCRMFVCQHFTRDVVWRPEYQAHALGATGLAAVAVVVEDPEATAPAYAGIFGVAPRHIEEGLLVETGSAPIALATRWKLGHRLHGVALPARPRPLLAALFIRVVDRARAAQVLRKGGFDPVALADGSYAIGADQAHGVALVFG
jgi:catechol 2,3-dioxygenase-like lactoylglutathione lyase family enzyme